MRAALAEAEERLRAAGCDTPRVDAELVLAHVLDTTRSGVRAHGGRTLSEAELAEVRTLVARRERREPLAYVLGEWGFRGLTLTVDARALVPRPETEVVVGRALARLEGREEPRVLDVGTGSGAIALAIAHEHPGARVTAADVSDDALALAAENVERTGLGVDLLRWDLFDGLPDGPWNLVVSNPPYVAADELPDVPPEVREWEPRIAVVGEGATETIAESARGALARGGALVLETADSDGRRVAGLLRELGYREVEVTPDLSGRDRVVEGVRK